MTDKWKLTEDDHKQLLLVTTVRLNVLKNDYTENHLDETSESIDPSRNQATAESCQHDKTRKQKQTDGDAQLHGRSKSL